MIEWIWPYVFTLAPLPLLVRWLLSPVERQQAALTVPDVSAFQLESHASGEGLGKRVPWRMGLLWLLWVGLINAAGRPPWAGVPGTTSE